MKPIIAITGSVGKTTTKEMIASIMQQRLKTFKSIRNLNLTENIAEYQRKLKNNYDAVVLEYAASQFGNLSESCKLIQPNISIVTNVGTAHLERFENTIEGIAKVKSELIQGMDQDGLLFLNADDKNSKLLNRKNFRGKIFSIGIEKQDADFSAHSINYTRLGMSFCLNNNNEQFYIYQWGQHNVYNALFAIGVGYTLGFPTDEIREGLKSYEKPYSRLTHYRLLGIDIIDDTFNASPESMKAAITILSNVGKGKNIAILGTISGLGNYSFQAHKEIGEHLTQNKIHALYTFGNEAKWIGEGAIKRGFDAKSWIHSNERSELHAHLTQINIEPNTTFLLKATTRLNMNKTVNFLARHCASISKNFFKKIVF